MTTFVDISTPFSSDSLMSQIAQNTFSLDDDEAYDTDLEDRVESPARRSDVKGTRAYIHACEQLNIHPVKAVIATLTDHGNELNLRYRNMGPNHAKALTVGLKHNSSIEYVDIRETGLGGEGTMHIGDMLKQNHYIIDLNLDGNTLGTVGSAMIGNALGTNTCLTTLSLSDNRICDADVRYLAAGLEQNNKLMYIDLSRNEIAENGAKALASALGKSCLERLNISWNKIRKTGGVAICQAIATNTCLKELNISWNGLGFEGSLAIGEMLRSNTYLRDLDLTNNRIHWEGVKYIAGGLKVNGTLETIKIGLNPITMSGCQRLLDAACATDSALAYIGFDGIPINSAIAEKAKKIMAKRGMTLVHAQVHDTVEVFGTKKPRRKDEPLQMLFRHLHERGIRVMDLFRTFYTDNENRVSTDQFIRGLKKCYLPMTEQEMMKAAKSIQDHGKISYQDIKNGIKAVTMDIRAEERKKNEAESKRREERVRIMFVPQEKRLQTFMQGENNSPMASSSNMTAQGTATRPSATIRERNSSRSRQSTMPVISVGSRPNTVAVNKNLGSSQGTIPASVASKLKTIAANYSKSTTAVKLPELETAGVKSVSSLPDGLPASRSAKHKKAKGKKNETADNVSKKDVAPS